MPCSHMSQCLKLNPSLREREKSIVFLWKTLTNAVTKNKLGHRGLPYGWRAGLEHKIWAEVTQMYYI